MKYHQTVYDDGRNQYIVERNHRSRRAPDGDATDLEMSLCPLALRIHGITSSKSLLSSNSRSYPYLKASSRHEKSVSRDGLAKESKISSAVVVATALQRPTTNTIETCSPASQRWVELTPPPTPRLRRLSSPEIPDLDVAPFCACDEANLVAYCTACKKKGDSRSDWY
jgi:hypothetical protein